MRMTLSAATVAALTLFSAAAVAQPGSKPGPAELFAQRCASCHMAPDPGRASDRAWLAQVAVTA